jgi:DNA-binding transcriptional ArsR family regulator
LHKIILSGILSFKMPAPSLDYSFRSLPRPAPDEVESLKRRILDALRESGQPMSLSQIVQAIGSDGLSDNRFVSAFSELRHDGGVDVSDDLKVRIATLHH